MKERTKKLCLLGAMALAIFALVIGSRSSSSSSSSDASLRNNDNYVKKISSASELKADAEGVEFLPDGSVLLHEIKRRPFADPGVKFMPDGSVHFVRDADRYVCGRKLPFALDDTSTWPTPPLENNLNLDKKSSIKEVILLDNDEKFGEMNLGVQLTAFFRAYDVSNDTRRPLYITQNSWAFRLLFQFFFGPAVAVEQNSGLWDSMQSSLGVTIVENEGVLKLSGIDAHPQYSKPHDFLVYNSRSMEDAKSTRNHRNTVLRRMFRYPSTLGVLNVCSAFDTLLPEEKEYAVLHIADARQREDYLKEQNKEARGKGQHYEAAAGMDPKYVREMFQRADMIGIDVYLVDGNERRVDEDARAKFEDASKEGILKIEELPQQFKHVGSHVYLAVLANVYLGSPADPTSLWIARMRYALGMKNTFIFVDNVGGKLESFVDDDSYLELYDAEKLGVAWMG